jgi:hypothetical protein
MTTTHSSTTPFSKDKPLCDKLDFFTLDAKLDYNRKLKVLFNNKHIGFVTIEEKDINALKNHQLVILKNLTDTIGNILPNETLSMSKNNNLLNITYMKNGTLEPGCVKLTDLNEGMLALGGKTRRRRRTHKRKRSKKSRKTKSRK